MNINELAAEVHADHVNWWKDPRTGDRIVRIPDQLLMLTVSELAEGMEGVRKNLMDDHLPHRKMIEVELADAKIRILDMCGGMGIPLDLSQRKTQKLHDDPGAALFAIVKHLAAVGNMIGFHAKMEHIGAAMSGALNAIDFYAEKFGHDVDGAMVEKRAYNKTRADHKTEARLAAGGKQW